MLAAAQIAEGLAAHVGAAQVRVGEALDDSLLADWTHTVRGAAAAAVFPATVQEVSQVLAFCNAHRIGVVPQGGNTGMSGGGVPLPDGDGSGCIILSLRRLNRVREVNAAARTMTVEAGCILESIHAKAAEAGLFFPLSLGAKGSCQIGGNLATNAGGLNVLRYGSMRDLCLGVEAVCADGRVLGGLSGLHKDNSGYDLRHLLIGSEGTLAVFTAAVLKLFAPPQVALTAWALPPSPAAAVELLNFIQRESGDALAAFELLPAELLQLITQHKPQLPLPPSVAGAPWAVLLEAVDADAERMQQILLAAVQRGLVSEEIVLAMSEQQRADFWQVREETPIVTAAHGRWYRADVALPRSALAAFIDELRARLQAVCAGRYILGFGHAGDGNLHIALRPHDEDPQQHPQRMEELQRALYDCVADYGGTFSAEHGIGQFKTGIMRRYKDAVALDIMRGIKAALDKNGILNPGKGLPGEGD